MLRNLSPHTTAYAARCKPDHLRDWRRHGFLVEVGERDGKGHLYSVQDAVRIAVAAQILRGGVQAGQAFCIVKERRALIDALTTASSDQSDYVLTIGIDPDVRSQATSITNAPLKNVSLGETTAVAIQVNVSSIIRTAIERIQSHLQHSAECAA